jgi:hypothetical protein
MIKIGINIRQTNAQLETKHISPPAAAIEGPSPLAPGSDSCDPRVAGSGTRSTSSRGFNVSKTSIGIRPSPFFCVVKSFGVLSTRLVLIRLETPEEVGGGCPVYGGGGTIPEYRGGEGCGCALPEFV